MGAENFIANAHPNYIDTLYREFQNNNASVDDSWKKFFEGFEFAIASGQAPNALATSNGKSGGSVSSSDFDQELKVYVLIQRYRVNAHLIADTNPIRARKNRTPDLALDKVGLSKSDLTKEFAIGKELGLGKTSLQNILDWLKETYAGSFGIEYQYIRDAERRHWLREKFEKRPRDYNFSFEKKKRILKKLNETTVLEKFLGTKYLGEKRFSLEGGESTIPALDAIINKSAELGVNEVIIGMAHRGRLNVLANIMGKTYAEIFNEFEGSAPNEQTMGDGDVKYHMGFSSIHKAKNDKDVHLKLTPNPSHLEAVNPVVEGFARAKADAVYKSDYDKILPILIHGDAAIAGQGIVYEVVQMSKLEGYYTGGTIHYVINNQIGFTTDFDDARSSDYCTSVASTIQAPVIHVNGDDVEAVVYASEVAAEWREKFNSDIFIDMVCYRKHGHNEADDPKFTQPTFYSLIDKHDNPRDIYIQKLTQRGDIEKTLAEKMDKDFWGQLQDRLDMVKQKPLPVVYQEPDLAWKALRPSKPSDFKSSPKTAISKKAIANIVKGMIKLPEGFTPLRKANKMLEGRRKLMRDQKTVDWAGAELLAYGSILIEGKNIRMSGQDVKRGTFSHRHAVIFDEKTNEQHNRLNFIQEKQGKMKIYNSLLSEFGVLGFEFGYSIASPDNLVIWEAQFGDFTNGAQTIIDQFISSCESKWNIQSGLVMLLPHGYEGQGPEHSSARLERFLQMGAENNISITNITSPSNFFHVFRRQLERPFRKPLINMSPKSLLRHPKCISSIDEISTGGFREIIEDDNTLSSGKVTRVIFCSGKVYYDLLAKKEADKRKDVAIIRIEQLYPLATEVIDKILKKYKNAEPFWVQEEPENMGAYGYILRHYPEIAETSVCRKASASPATGYKKIHLKEQADIVDQAFKK